jgi:hypothetical protein
MQSMRIGRPEVVVDATSITLQADIRFSRESERLPERLWFRYPRQFEPLLYCGPEPFVVSLSSLASVLPEPIDVASPISERLSAGLHEYWTIFNRWNPRRFQSVELHCEGYAADAPASGAAGTAFSGGVDSFFTLHRHLQDREPRAGYQVKYALFVHGFDIPLADTLTYDLAAAAYEEALAGCGVALIRVATNLRRFIDRAGWGMSHGSGLCGTALTLTGIVGRFFVPSSKSYTTLEPWGSDPLIDGLLSTDRLQVIHDGAAFTRFEKLHAMRDWQLMRPLLRTCYARPDGLRNCGRCANCRRTMMVLAALGILDTFETFPPVTSSAHFLTSKWETPHERLFGKQSIAHARANGRMGLVLAGQAAMGWSGARRAWKLGWRKLLPRI